MAKGRGTFGQRELADVSPSLRELEKEAGKLTEFVLSGRCSDFAEYRAKTSEIKGLRTGMAVVEKALRRARGDGDEEEEE